MTPFSSLSLDPSRLLLRCLRDLVLFCSAMGFCTAIESQDLPVAKQGTDSSQTSLLLVWHDPYGLLPRSFDLAAKEVRSVFKAIGTEAQIVRGEHWDERGRAQPDGIVVKVILHKSTASTWGLDEWAMGAAVGNYAYVFFPDIVRALDLNPDGRSLREPRVRGLLARAIGRVAAHEVVHIVAPSRPHTAGGLMTEALTRRCLTRRHLHVDPDTAAFVLDRLYPREKESPDLVVTSPTMVASDTSKQK